MPTSTLTVAVMPLSPCARISSLSSVVDALLGLPNKTLLCLALSLCSSLVFANAEVAAGRVQVVVGSAKLVDSAGHEFAIAKGSEIKQGDRIVTEEGSLVQVRLNDGTLVSVRTNTDLTFERYTFGKEAKQESSLLLKLAKGALRSITGLIGTRNPDAYKVLTPTATIGIRGTDHEPVFIPEPPPGITPLGEPGTYDKVNSGATFIATTLGSVDVRPGQVAFVPITPGVPPRVLPAVPEFFRKLDPKREQTEKNVAPKEGRNLPLRQLTARPTTLTDPKDALATQPVEPARTLDGRTLLSPITSTLVPTETTRTLDSAISPTLAPATSTMTEPRLTTTTPTTTLIAPTTTLVPRLPTTTTTPTTTIISPTTILPIVR